VTVFADDLFALKCAEYPQADLVACITGAFGYFGALPSDVTEAACRKIAEHVKPSGSLLLELYQFNRFTLKTPIETMGYFLLEVF